MKDRTLFWIAGSLALVWLMKKNAAAPQVWNYSPTFITGTQRLNPTQMREMADGTWQISHDAGSSWEATNAIGTHTIVVGDNRSPAATPNPIPVPEWQPMD